MDIRRIFGGLKNVIWLRSKACPMKIHGMGCVRESKIRLCIAGRRVNVLLASSGCAPHCTRRPAPGVLPL
jgi:hypothetical protein